MSDKLELQREILAAAKDPDKLAAIAEREGIDPRLWKYAQELFARAKELGEEAERSQ